MPDSFGFDTFSRTQADSHEIPIILMIFNRFQRVDKKGVKGTGLSLAIVKRVVELHGGSVWIEDNPEGGKIFYVDIPKS